MVENQFQVNWGYFIPINGDTPLKINMEPKNAGLEDDFPFQTGDFQVPS